MEGNAYKTPENEAELRVLVAALAARTQELRQAKTTLAETIRRYDDLVEHSRSIILEWDSDGTILFLNRWGLQFFGFTQDELIGKNVVGTIVAPTDESGDDLAGKMASVQKTPDEYYSNENENLTKAGERVWISWTNRALRDEEGRLLRTLSVGIDRTRQRLAELELGRYRDQLEAMVAQRTTELASRNQEVSVAAERLAVAARAAKLGVWEWDVPQNKLIWDDTMYTLYGARREDFGADYEAWTSSLHDEDRSRVQHAIELALRGEREYEVEFRIVRPDGGISHIQASGLTSFQDVGAPLRMIGVNVDVTERKQAEVERQQLEEQLRVSQKMEAIGSLAGGIAHDFNNLLGLVLSYTDFAVGALPEDGPVVADLIEVKRAAERAAALTRQLLAFSRKQVLQPVSLSLNEITRGLEKMLRRILGEDIELIPALAPDLGAVKADAGQMEQVLMNLLVNARDAMPRGGKITIETANVELDAEWTQQHPPLTPGRYVRLTVTDTGSGIDKTLQGRIFEPFFTTKERGKGTGLGLSMVYGIVTQSGGQIVVDSRVGRGSSFAIYLPRQQVVEATTPERRPVTTPTGGSETILVVEDEEALLKVAVRALTGAGYTVIPASSGDEALLACSQHEGPLDLIATDVVMPKMSGATLVAELYKIRPELKVLYMSGYTDDAILHHGVSGAGPPLLSKPFTAARLTQKVREVLDGEKPSPHTRQFS